MKLLFHDRESTDLPTRKYVFFTPVAIESRARPGHTPSLSTEVGKPGHHPNPSIATQPSAPTSKIRSWLLSRLPPVHSAKFTARKWHSTQSSPPARERDPVKWLPPITRRMFPAAPTHTLRRKFLRRPRK